MISCTTRAEEQEMSFASVPITTINGGGTVPQHQQQMVFVEQHNQQNADSSDGEYLFVGLNNAGERSSPPMRAMIELEHAREKYVSFMIVTALEV